MSRAPRKPLSHVDPSGAVRMVDVSDKSVTVRQATATAQITMRPEVLDDLIAGKLKKGEALTTAKLAGLAAAKLTGTLIPLCHPLPLDWVEVTIERTAPRVLRITASARATARTGVEMEALTAAGVAALTLYDMAKAADRAIVIGPIQLEHKSGGRSGRYDRQT